MGHAWCLFVGSFMYSGKWRFVAKPVSFFWSRMLGPCPITYIILWPFQIWVNHAQNCLDPDPIVFWAPNRTPTCSSWIRWVNSYPFIIIVIVVIIIEALSHFCEVYSSTEPAQNRTPTCSSCVVWVNRYPFIIVVAVVVIIGGLSPFLWGLHFHWTLISN